MNLKTIGLLTVLAVAAPVVAEAAPATAITANTLQSTATLPTTGSIDAVAPGDSTAKIQKVWWRRGWGWGWRRPYYGYGWGWRRPYWRGYWGWRRPYWRRRWW